MHLFLPSVGKGLPCCWLYPGVHCTPALRTVSVANSQVHWGQQALTLEPSLYLRKVEETVLLEHLLCFHTQKCSRLLAYVVVKDGHESHMTVVWTNSRELSSFASAFGNNGVWSLGNAHAVLPGGWGLYRKQMCNALIFKCHWFGLHVYFPETKLSSKS